MAKVIAPITAKTAVIGKPRESSYETGKFSLFPRSRNVLSLTASHTINNGLATLIKSALNAKKYRFLVRSTAVAELWGGRMQILSELSQSVLPKYWIKCDRQAELA